MRGGDRQADHRTTARIVFAGMIAWVLWLVIPSLVGVWARVSLWSATVYTCGLVVSVLAVFGGWAWRFRKGTSARRVLLLGVQLSIVTLMTFVVGAMFLTPLVVLFGWTLFLCLPPLWGWWSYLGVAAASTTLAIVDAHRRYPEDYARIDLSDEIIGGAVSTLGYIALGAMTWCVLRLVALSDRLREAKEVEVREKLMRDQHDLVGSRLAGIQSLATLAERLLPTDPERALDELREIQRQASDAAGEARLLAHGQRAPDFHRDLPRCVRALESRGVDCEVDLQETLTGRARELGGWALLEATTNTLRHSRASTCSVTLHRLGATHQLTIKNNGVVTASNGEDRGSGLAGLRERLEEEDGELETSVAGDWFSLTARLPMGAGEGGSDR